MGDAKAAAEARDKGAARSLGGALADAPAPRRAPRVPKPKPAEPKPTAKPAKAAAAPPAPRRQTRKSLPSFTDATGAVHRRGDFVYCALDDAIAASLADADDDGAVCAGCGEGHKPAAGCGGKQRGKAAAGDDTSDDGIPIVECAACLDGWHLDCVDPPLARVPEAEWLCPPCEAGRKATGGGGDAARRPPRTRAEAFLVGRVGIVRVEAIWQEVGDEEKASATAKGKKGKKGAPSSPPPPRRPLLRLLGRPPRGDAHRPRPRPRGAGSVFDAGR